LEEKIPARSFVAEYDALVQALPERAERFRIKIGCTTSISIRMCALVRVARLW